MAMVGPNENGRFDAFAVEINSAIRQSGRANPAGSAHLRSRLETKTPRAGALSSAASANTPEQTIDSGIFLIDPLGQGIFIGLGLVGAFNIIPLPRLRSVHDRDRRPQHDDSAENRAQDGGPSPR